MSCEKLGFNQYVASASFETPAWILCTFSKTPRAGFRIQFNEILLPLTLAYELYIASNYNPSVIPTKLRKISRQLQLLKLSQQHEQSESFDEWYFRIVKPQYHNIRFAIIMMKSKFGRIYVSYDLFIMSNVPLELYSVWEEGGRFLSRVGATSFNLN